MSGQPLDSGTGKAGHFSGIRGGESGMGLRYYDHQFGQLRMKRRYVWAFWAYLAGTLSGLALLMATPIAL
mgnify:CR=1 FL=1